MLIHFRNRAGPAHGCERIRGRAVAQAFDQPFALPEAEGVFHGFLGDAQGAGDIGHAAAQLGMATQ